MSRIISVGAAQHAPRVETDEPPSTRITSADLRPSERPQLTEAKRCQSLTALNDTQSDYPKHLCAHQLFEHQVDQTPEGVAAVFESQRLTYSELNRRANKLAHHLRKLGVGPEVLVGICLQRSLEMLVALLGVLKAGGAYVPLDPSYPKERLAFTIDDARMPLLLTQSRMIEALPEHGAQVICLDSGWNAISAGSDANPVCTATPQNLAYVIYTSGSTGRPKGAMIPHRGLVNYLCWCTQAYAVADGLGTPVHSPLGFDLTITSLFPALLTGRPVILLPEGAGIDSLSNALRAGEDFSLVKITPAHLVLLGQSLAPEEAAGRTRAMIIGGEALTWEMLLFWHAYAPHTRLINEYGPTETVVGCCIYEAAPEDSQSGAVPIGRPIANTQLYVLDAHLHPVPAGVAGELFIGGDGVGRGYLNRPALTAERFVPDPFRAHPGARLYRTGDLVRHLPDGNLEFLGRVDHQVKVRGFRIELGEIEATLEKHPGISQSVVLARQDASGDTRLVGYVVPRQQPAPTVTELRRFLRERLPEYMVPSTFVLLETLPLTPNGKVNRKALPPPDDARPESDRGFEPPRDPVEQQLAEVWARLLGVRTISMHDDFFDLGGHSLLAIRLIAQIEKTFGRRLPLTTLLHATTLEAQADLLRQKDWSPSASSVVPIQADGARPPLFCVAGAGGFGLSFRRLALHMSADQPFYALRPPGLDDTQARKTRIEELAAHYIQDMRTVQPQGPYYLSGYSFGGIVAFEMAHQLHACGEKVALLVLFDTHMGRPPTGQRIRYHVRTLARLGYREKIPYFLNRVTGLTRRIREKTGDLSRRFSQGLVRSLLRPIREMETTSLQAQREYVPRVYPGEMTLLRAKEQPLEWDHVSLLGWDGLVAGGLELYHVPGSHLTMLKEPHVRAVAEQLGACLHRAQQNESLEPMPPSEALAIKRRLETF